MNTEKLSGEPLSYTGLQSTIWTWAPSSWCSPIFTCTTNKSISNLAGSQMASLQTFGIVGHRPLKASMATVSQANREEPLKA